jgi:parallel beta-helix repeat protein
MRNGSPAIIYANSQFSVTVRDKNRAMVIYSPVGYGFVPGTTASNTDQMTYNEGDTGAVTRVLTSRLQDYVSVKDFGAVGDGVTNDTAAIQAALNSGSVYFPETNNYYLITDDLTMVDGSTVTGSGYKSQIRQTVQGKNAFVAGHDCVISGIRVKMPVGNNLDGSKQNAVYINGKKNVTVRDNWLELADVAVSGVQARGASANITIINNIIYNGAWDGTAGAAANASDILFYSSASSTRIVIEGNYCLSNNSQGMFLDGLGYNADIAITGNICVTLDPATCTQGGSWSEIASGGIRRHGIVLGYNNTSIDGPRTVIDGNICRNTLWTGIYLQGTSAGRLVSNNVCSNNGYATSNTLSGGIYLIQGGNEQIEGNLILDFKNTDATGIGGITINAPTTPTIPSTVRDNFIQRSATHGISLGTSSALMEISGNTIVSSVGYDIYAVSSAGLTGVAGHHIVDNRIYRTSGSGGSILIDPQASTLITRIHSNRIRGFDNTTVSTFNAGIYVRFASNIYDIRDNTVVNFYHGLYFANYQTTNRSALIEGNVFTDCSIGISMGAANNNHTVPVVDNRFINMLVSETAAALGGFAVARICTREADRLIAQTYNAAPTTGAWAVGDRAMFTTPVAAGNIGAVCVTLGTPGTWKTFGAIAA